MAMYIDYPFSQVEFTCDNCGKKEYVEDCTTEKEAKEIIKEDNDWLEFESLDFCCRECFNLYIRNNYSPRREVWYILFVL